MVDIIIAQLFPTSTLVF